MSTLGDPKDVQQLASEAGRLFVGAQGDVGPGARQERRLSPRVVPAGRDSQDADRTR
jgi:hypothetical protein